MRPSRTTLLIGALLLVLLVGTLLLVRPATQGLPALSVRSTEPTGGRALMLWLETLGYRVHEMDTEPYAVDADVAALFVLEPITPFERDAVDNVAAWVEGGGRLVLVASTGPRRLLDRFGLAARFAGDHQREAVAVQPLLLRPPVERARVDAWDSLQGRDGLAPWLAAGDHVYLGSRPYGRGTVTVLTAPYPLSNEGLAAPDNAALALNLIAGLPPGARIAFDEYHHGFVRGSTRSLWRLLLDHYWGWALVYAVSLGYLYLWLRGRRFGRPLLPRVAPRRSVGEYVASLAALYRRAGQRAYVADRLADQLKRDLATALGVSPRLPDDEFAQVVAERRGAPPAPLAAVLARLRAGRNLREGDLLATAREADALKTQLLRR